MASQQSTADFIVEQIADAGVISVKKMFGAHALSCDGKMVGMVYNNQLYIKPTSAGKAFIGDFVDERPFPRGNPHLLISENRWNDREWLSTLIRISAGELPTPQKKTPRARTKAPTESVER